MTQQLYKGHISLTTAFLEEICLAATYPSSARRICNMYWVTGRSNMLGDRSPLLGSVFQTSPEICPLIIYPISCVALYLLNLLGRTPQFTDLEFGQGVSLQLQTLPLLTSMKLEIPRNAIASISLPTLQDTPLGKL